MLMCEENESHKKKIAQNNLSKQSFNGSSSSSFLEFCTEGFYNAHKHLAKDDTLKFESLGHKLIA